ncbi:MAG: hypothetical protein QXO32_06295 [Candidatus Bathyarchaeia archaeon]
MLVILLYFTSNGGTIRKIGEPLTDFKIGVVGVLEVDGPPTPANIKQIVEIGKSLPGEIGEEAYFLPPSYRYERQGLKPDEWNS